MKFHIVYIEITNICGLQCSFCPPKINPIKTLSLEEFENIIAQVAPLTDLVALHVLGDPLVISDLEKYLDIVQKYNLKAMITTTGYHLNDSMFQTLSHSTIKQINFSLNSFNKNSMKKSLNEYLQPILDFCQYKVEHNLPNFINLRLWNLDQQNSEEDFNTQIINSLENFFNIKIEINKQKESIRIDNKVLINFDQYFQWPSLKNDIVGDGYCHGLQSQFAILVDGRVVPCCLDCDGVIELGNITQQSLQDILNSSKASKIIEGFKNNKAVEELCQKCSYKERFNQ